MIGVTDIIDNLPKSTIDLVMECIHGCTNIVDKTVNYMAPPNTYKSQIEYGNYIHNDIATNKYNIVRTTLSNGRFEYDVYKSHRNKLVHGIVDYIDSSTIIDFKTGKIYDTHLLQLALYWWLTDEKYKLELIYINMNIKRCITILNKRKFKHAVSIMLSTIHAK